MCYSDLVRAAAQIPDFDIYDLLEPARLASARALVEKTRQALDDSRAAIASWPAMPTKFNADYFSSHTQELQLMRQLACAFRLAGNLAMRDADIEYALTCGLDLVHLAHCQRRNGLVVDLLTACATWTMGISILVQVRGHLNSEQRAKLMRQLIQSEAECEPTTAIVARDALWTSIVDFPPFDEEQCREGLAAEFTPEEVEEFVAMHRELAEAEPSSDQRHCYDASDRSLAYQRLLVVDLAIGSYQAVHAAPPPDLEALVPTFLLARMPDPFTNSDFMYRVDHNQPVLYSVGAKRKDLGGLRGDWAEAALGSTDMFLT